MYIKEQKITILGAQRSGQALARLVTRLGGQAYLSDQGSRENVDSEFLQWAAENHVCCEFNGHTAEFMAGSYMVVLSPGVPLESTIVTQVKALGIRLMGEIEFAAQFCKKPIIAVTGSNGKTTVVTLLRDVLKLAGHTPCLCGNVGQPFSDYVLDLKDVDFVVLEVSSFQLQTVMPVVNNGSQGFKPHIAVLLNCTENHLDRHQDMAEYLNAKARIFFNQDEGDYAVVGIPLESLRKAMPEITKMRGLIRPLVALPGKVEGRVYNLNERAVLDVAALLGISTDLCRNVFRRFKGVEHRCERLESVGEVDFINDAKSTTVEATRWALHQLEQPVILICGGRDKQLDFSVLKEVVRKRVKHICVIGEAQEKIRQCFADVCPVTLCNSLEDAVMSAYGHAEKGDGVLLSPMCASFDMFKNFEHRGCVFKEAVTRLSQTVFSLQ